MPADLETPPPPERSTMLDTEGGVIADIYDQNRELIDLEDMAPIAQDAMIAIEDNRFYEHGGFDFQGTFRAALRTLQGQTEGGSSITQQYVKNILIESAESQEELEAAREETLDRKIRELRYAASLEQDMTKDEILEGYLNIAYFGDGAYGLESAAQHYFGVSADELDLSQSSLLAGIVRYPYQYNPRTNPEQAMDRRQTVLNGMVDAEMITEEEADEVRAEEELDLDVSEPDNGCMPATAPFFCDYIVREIEQNEEFGEDAAERARWLRTAGLEIHTTLHPDMQQAAQDAVDSWVPRDNESRKVAAQVLIEPGTGEIRAMAQSRDYGPDESNLGETSINFMADYDHGGSTGFQPGSTFKPITLAAALDQGMGFGTSYDSPGSTTVSGQVNCNGGRLPSWTMSNAGDSDAGRLDMVGGTQQSSNTYFAQLQADVGLCETIEMAETLGLQRGDGTSFDNPNTQANNSFTLGSEEISPMGLANAYATFASGGELCEPLPFTRIEDNQSDTTIELESDCEQVIDSDVADGVSYLLQQTFSGGTADGLEIGRPAAGKTGTTDGGAAAWFAGYTPNLAGTVFVGDPRGPQNYPLRNITLGGRHYSFVYGATIPGPIWQETFQESVQHIPNEDFPAAPSQYRSGGGNATQASQQSGGVPDVVGQSEQAAVSTLEEAGYTVNVSDNPIRSEEAAGSVAAVNPNPGTALPSGATVNVFLSADDNTDATSAIPGDPISLQPTVG
ncbi:penicillin-binding protein [Lipingzhangella sp. LS1_29]|uniref:Penicillin-binding protein n=1 Tax=Lipingzhangella rawalii TaxID=2055835 RepID=A0ABU2H4S9_9ACTN|nr:penicillin-binding protein [Lipingzhangella rawalii]MDS1270002.1 penicillin-binding protein [Lipingzhangella rawalii]